MLKTYSKLLFSLLRTDRITSTNSVTFIWLRCHRKIKDRLAADEAMLGTPLWKLWKLGGSRLMTRLRTSGFRSMLNKFAAARVPFRTHTDETGKSARQYLFSRSTVATWCHFFTITLRQIKELAVSNDTQPASIMKLSTAFFTLNCLLYDNNAFAKLLALPSLDVCIRYAINAAEERQKDEQRDERLGEYLERHYLILRFNLKFSKKAVCCPCS
jgi:hypothetical protein